MHEPVHLAELLGSFAHACSAPAKRHLTVTPALHVRRVISADLDHRLDGVRRPQCSCERWRDLERDHGEGLTEALAKTPRSTGVRALQLTGELFELGLGTKGTLIVVDRAHLCRH